MTSSTRRNSRLGILVFVIGSLLCSGRAHAGQSIAPPGGAITTVAMGVGVRGYTVTFSTATTILSIGAVTQTKAGDVEVEVWDAATQTNLASTSNSGPLNFNALADHPYIIGFFVSSTTDATYGQVSSPSFPYTVGSAIISAAWAGTGLSDAFPSNPSSSAPFMVLTEPPEIAPATPTTTPGGSIAFTVTNPTGLFTWSLPSNPSGGSIDPNTGVYTAGPTGNVTDTVQATEGGNVGGPGGPGGLPGGAPGAPGGPGGIGPVTPPVLLTTTVTVVSAVTVTPAGPSTTPLGTIAFSASSVAGATFTWAFVTNASGGSIDAMTGAYVAGTKGGVTDVIAVTDSSANTVNVNIAVGAGVAIGPASPSTSPLGSIAFTASGGSGTGYEWSVGPNLSTATIDPVTGAYVAGSTADVSDTVNVVDSLGNTARVSVLVGDGVTIHPATPTVAPRGSTSFTAVGGSGTGYEFALSSSPSGGSITAAGAYQAGGVPNVTDVVSVVDSVGNTATTNVTVGPGVSLLPSLPASPPRGPIAFSASGGSGTGYTFSVSTNRSLGSIIAGTGMYTAGPTPNVVDVVTATDSFGNTASENVTVGAGVTVTPVLPSVGPLGVLTLVAAGGSGTGYVWTLTTRASGAATITEAGAYTAGPTALTVDVAHVVDSLGNTADVNISVGGALAIDPPQATTFPKGSVAFGAMGGGGMYTFSLTTNASSGTINAQSGAYVAGSTPNVVDVVKVADQNSISVTANVGVGAGVSIAPVTATVKAGGSVQCASAGGSGTGYTWSVSTNLSGATISTTGTYVAGPKGNVVDLVTVKDSVGNSATATFTVTVAASVDGGVAVDDAGLAGADGGAVAEGGEGVSEAGADAGTTGLAASGGGCGCKVAATPAPASSAVAGLSLLALALLRRRRQDKQPVV